MTSGGDGENGETTGGRVGSRLVLLPALGT